MNVRKYALPPIEGVGIGPQISECTISSGYFSFYDFLTRNDSLCFFPEIQPSHIIYVFSINGKLFTISFSCSIFRPPNFKCPNSKFHNQESSCTSDWNDVFIFAPSFLKFDALPFFIYALNVVSDCASFSLSTTCIIFLLMDGFNVNGNILLFFI
jgi:hypothetical protein